MHEVTQQFGKRQNLRAMVRGAYDIQKLRIQTGNRIVGNMKVRMGQIPGESEEELDDDAKAILKQIREAYRRITDGTVKFPGRADFKGDPVIADYTELCLVSSYVRLEEQERQQFKQLTETLEEFPIWTEWLRDIKGIGPAMGGVIVSEIDIAAAKYVSSLWAYAGLDVAPDGRGRSRKAEHLVKREYVNAKGETAEKNSITFNPFLKTKLVGVLASSFLKQKADGCPYRVVYDNYKHRIENHPNHVGKTKGHRHAMAMRYAVKVFLQDLYVKWRTIEGLPVASPYSEAKLGMMPHAA